MFAEEICLPFLLRVQNSDGGWGHRPGGESRAEPTAWSLLTFAHYAEFPGTKEARQCGEIWLRSAQLPDGSWPAAPGAAQGSWVTSVACIALAQSGAARENLRNGVDWILRAWPRSGSLWQRILQRLRSERNLTRQNKALRGWSWTPGTSSWVEPTAYALILLQRLPEELRSPLARRRAQLGEAMLLDRMCPGGGWNTGNPMVYGAAAQPFVISTAWALLALQHCSEREEVQKGFRWLQSQIPGITGGASLALAHLCLRLFGRELPPLEPMLRQLHARNEFLGDVLTAAWAALSLSADTRWLAPRH